MNSFSMSRISDRSRNANQVSAFRWPTHFFASFTASRKISWIFSAILMGRALAATPARLLRSASVLALAAIAGLAVGALDLFRPGWEIYPCLFLVPLAAAVLAAVVANRRRSFEFYRPGSASKVLVKDEMLYLDLNERKIFSKTSDVVRVEFVAGVATLVFSDTTVIVLPRKAFPAISRGR